MSNLRLIETLKEKLSGEQKTIVLPEGEDERVLSAAVTLKEEGIVTPVLLGNIDKVKSLANELSVDVSSIEIIDPKTSELRAELKESLLERRKGKVDEDKAETLLNDVNYFGTMLVYTKKADGLVSGAVHSTGDTVRPALQIIKTKEGVSKTSGVFFMIKGDEQYVFGDCAINPTLSTEDLAEIAVESNNTAKAFGMTPKVAMLSFSTKGSADTEETEKVRNAVEYAKKLNPDMIVDGEFQFDAAFVPSVAQKKAPDSDIQGDANVFIFPSLEAGNIGYKIAQRLGGYDAIGPILQGLNAPVNDLSRGCSKEDVYNLTLLTAAQALD
ncbi:phosphate acetyltransferase [Abyssicoccus albus]|uniref:phosphate acetyltransferase n=1 Tax=Abyssicoccus albus TaxID=1817405 RepID=UPI00097E2025|nr:phosphate acetyltransferase [Abyssicoccus albus]AQL55645.1 phosphate acetyltransferase [Abyssicoccus albus]